MGILSSSIWFAIIAALFYGFSGPSMRYAHQLGVSTRDFIFISSSITLVVAILWPADDNLFSTLISGKVVMVSFIAGSLLTGGFIFLNQSLSAPSSLASVVLVISATNPLIGSLISLFYLGENKKVILPMLIVGSLLTIIGAIIVVLSAKNNT